MGRARRQVKQEPPAVLRGLGRACTQKTHGRRGESSLSSTPPSHTRSTHECNSFRNATDRAMSSVDGANRSWREGPARLAAGLLVRLLAAAATFRGLELCCGGDRTGLGGWRGCEGSAGETRAARPSAGGRCGVDGWLVAPLVPAFWLPACAGGPLPRGVAARTCDRSRSAKRPLALLADRSSGGSMPSASRSSSESGVTLRGLTNEPWPSLALK